MARTGMWLQVGVLVALGFGPACSSSGGTEQQDAPVVTGGTGGSAGSTGIIGMTKPPDPPPVGGGSGGITSPPPAGSGGTVVMAGSGGTVVMAGSGGMAGADPAGAGGVAGMDMAGTGSDPGTGLHREADPTMMTAMNKGEYTVEKYTNGLRDGAEYGAATVYYPTDAEPPFGAVTIVPGFTAYQNSIAGWGPFLASHGIIAMTIDTNTTGDLPALRAAGLMDALETVKAENTRAGSPLMGKVDMTRLGVAGWSMGGGGTLIAAAGNPTLKAAVSFAAWGPTGGAMNKVPVLMFEATLDPLAAGMSDGFFQETPDSTPKMLFEVAGAGHDVANDPGNSGKIIGLYGLSWFKVFLEGDERYRQFLTAAMPSITSNFQTNVK